MRGEAQVDKSLSIIVPSYNMEAYLPKCLGGLVVAPEVMEKLEVLVVNDGSKDRTSEIAHEFEAKWPGVFRVIDKPNGHYGSCINAALPVATGKFVKILDADDFVDGEAFAAFVREIAETDADLVIANFCRVNPDGEVVQDVRYGLPVGRDFPFGEIGADVDFLPIHAIAYNRRVFEGTKYHQLEGIPYTDCQWSNEPMLRVKTVRFVPKTVTCYLVGRDGQSMSPEARVKGLGQQIQVDLYLAGLHAHGRPEGVDVQVWNYFDRLVCREVSIAYRIAAFGESGRFPPIRVGRLFDSVLAKVNPAVRRRAAEKGYAELVVARVIKVNAVRIWRVPVVGDLLVALVRLYMKARRG